MKNKLMIRAFVHRLPLLLWLSGTFCWGQSTTYHVHLTFDKPLHATVEAKLDVPNNGTVFTDDPAGGYKWDTFIRNLRLVRENGTMVDLQPAGRGHWLLPAGTTGQVRLSYDADLSFTDTGKVETGSQRGGQFFTDSLYLVNRALFVMSDTPGPRDIEFDVPPNFEIATPWESKGAGHYRARDNNELVNNTTVLGKFPSFRIVDGEFELKVVLPGSTQDSKALIEPALKSILHEYLRIFPQTPKFHVLLSYFRGPEENGEAYEDSGAMTSVDPVIPENRILWANFFAHELFHHWNGNLIVGNDDGEYFGTTEWFAEGATEYVANRTLVRTGIINKELFLKKMETNIGMYVYWKWAAPFNGISLQDAGAKTALPMPAGMIAKTYNRPGIYSGGWVATFCLDTIIQKQTGGRKGLDDLFRLMLTRFALTGKKWTPNDLENAASAVAETDLSSFFSRYIASRESLPVKECLLDAGLDASIVDYGGEVYITAVPTPTASALAIQQQLFAKNPEFKK